MRKLVVLLFVLPVAAAGEEERGMRAAVRGDPVAAAEAFRKAPKSRHARGRLTAARKLANARLEASVRTLMDQKRWRELAEVTACGLAVQANHRRYVSAAKRIKKMGLEPPPLDARIRQWGEYGPVYADAQLLIADAVAFLKRTQEAEGHWNAKKHGGFPQFTSGVTALALMAVLPHDVASADRAAAALLKMQHEDDGLIGSRSTHNWVYNHSLAVEALARWMRRTGKEARHLEALQRAVDYLLKAQNPGLGWRYEPRGGDNDTCATVRCVCALRAAQRAGATVDPASFRSAVAWVTNVTDPKFGQVGYNTKGGVSARTEEKLVAFPPEKTQSMTAAGAIVYAHGGKDPFAITRCIARVDRMLPIAETPDMYYWELATRMYVMTTGRVPARWYRRLVGAVRACRTGDGAFRACGAWGGDGGRVYAAAMCALALSAPYWVERVPALNPTSFRAAKRRTVVVPGWTAGVATGIYVDRTTVLRYEATGEVDLYYNAPSVGPEGSKKKFGNVQRVVKTAPYGCLLARIDDGEPFVFAPGADLAMTSHGQLWLFVNDADAGNNEGAWELRIQLVR